ncbi:peptidoglycan editing factor PgeF [Chlorobium limicola]|nr:peptidoglycan editing factor PgeF [Chlorobium limicola]
MEKSMLPEYLVPGIFSGINNLVALQTTRNGGASPAPFNSLNFGKNTGDSAGNIRQNTVALCRSLNIAPDTLAGSDQVHGTKLLHVRQPGFYSGYDALATAEQGIYLCIYTADCFPVLLFDPVNRAAAAIHAGWKGTACMIVPKTITFMQQRFRSNPDDILAWIGTGISQAAYEVEFAVADNFSPAHYKATPSDNGKYLLDLAGANLEQLLRSGVPEKQIETSTFCSSRDSNLFFSYRRDAGKTGRMVSLIGLTPP